MKEVSTQCTDSYSYKEPQSYASAASEKRMNAKEDVRRKDNIKEKVTKKDAKRDDSKGDTRRNSRDNNTRPSRSLYTRENHHPAQSWPRNWSYNHHSRPLYQSSRSRHRSHGYQSYDTYSSSRPWAREWQSYPRHQFNPHYVSGYEYSSNYRNRNRGRRDVQFHEFELPTSNRFSMLGNY